MRRVRVNTSFSSLVERQALLPTLHVIEFPSRQYGAERPIVQVEVDASIVPAVSNDVWGRMSNSGGSCGRRHARAALLHAASPVNQGVLSG